MPLATTQGFVLGCEPYKEQDRIVSIFTLDKGTIRAIAPGSLRARNRFGSLFELFTEGEFQYYWQENREFITISRGDIVRSYFNTVSNPTNIFYFYLIADIFLKFIPLNNSDKRLYRLIQSILDASTEAADTHLLLAYFLVWILRIEGTMFNPRTCANCGTRNLSQAWFKLDYRGVLCPKCRSTEPISLLNEEMSFLEWTRKHPPKELETWKNNNSIDIPKLIRAFTRKIEFDGECTLKSSQYLPEFA